MYGGEYRIDFPSVCLNGDIADERGHCFRQSVFDRRGEELVNFRRPFRFQPVRILRDFTDVDDLSAVFCECFQQIQRRCPDRSHARQHDRFIIGFGNGECFPGDAGMAGHHFLVAVIEVDVFFQQCAADCDQTFIFSHFFRRSHRVISGTEPGGFDRMDDKQLPQLFPFGQRSSETGVIIFHDRIVFVPG